MTLKPKTGKAAKARRPKVKPKRRAAPAARGLSQPPDADLRDRFEQQGRELAEARKALAEALEQQTATSEVLGVISSSAGELQPVFNAMLANATRICNAKFGSLYMYDGELFHVAALHNAPPAFAEARRRQSPFRPHLGSGLGAVVETLQTVNTPDMMQEPGYIQGDPVIVAGVELGGYRSVVAVPMLREKRLIGVIGIYRQEVRPFTDKQIELVKNFAAQAVIAIENAQLLGELRQRTGDLTESLEQQTATSEVLQVISSSPADLKPVFQAMLENATRICGAAFGALYLSEGDALRRVALHNAPQALAEFSDRRPLLHRNEAPGVDDVVDRVVKTRQPVQIADLSIFEPDSPVSKFGGARTVLTVPMFNDRKFAGVIVIYHKEVRPFTDKQIELVKNFAAQAVIAIENARLLNELRQRTDDLSESLEQQTATSEVLQVISGSPGNLEPVFQATLENATRICRASSGIFNLIHPDSTSSVVAMYNVPDSFAALRQGEPRFLIGPKHPLARVAATQQVVHVVDLTTDAGYIERDPPYVAIVEQAGARTLLMVPLLKDARLVGAIAIFRQEVRPFTDKQIELVQNFAAQAVIAIENARLLSELRQRTGDLTESLEQQTSTSEVLKVISTSSGELDPVFRAILENASRLCSASLANLILYDGQEFRVAAIHGPTPEFRDLRERDPVVRTGPKHPLRRILASNDLFHIADVREEESYLEREEATVKFVDTAGARTVLMVPMLREKRLIGVIGIYRREVRPFTEKQIALIQNFAEQAMIAVENARLLNELRERTEDLTEALEQQTATSEVLQVISSSPGNIEPVFKAMLDNAAHICEATSGFLFRAEGDGFRVVASLHRGDGAEEIIGRRPLRFGPSTPIGRLVSTRQTVHVPNLAEDRAYLEGEPVAVWVVEHANVRSLLVVPMLKGDELIGVFGIERNEVKPFTDKQIELVQNFAAQAVIAIENTRLLNELRQRTDDLTESLEQQTATSEVLRVISSSPGDLEPVFQAVLDNAVRICEANFGNLMRYEDGFLRVCALYGANEDWAEARRLEPVVRGGPNHPFSRVIRTGRLQHIADMREDEAYLKRDPSVIQFVEKAGARTNLIVPMLKEDELIGAIAIYRHEVRPFTDKQIELVQNFAAQAVIAIENTRLLNELRQRTDDLSEALERQTATSDVLSVISSSQGELAPVFQSMLENATRLCAAQLGNLLLYDGAVFKVETIHRARPEWEEVRRRDPIIHWGPVNPLRRLVASKQILHIADAREEQAYIDREPSFSQMVDGAGARTLLVVPMLKEGELIGAFAVYRQDVRPFHDKQIELVQNFAAQAVIAIENTRLLNELRQRTDDLTEALEQQTATSEVLEVISRSPGELEPVFQTMVANAAQICGAKFGGMFRFEGGDSKLVAGVDLPQQFVEFLRKHAPQPGPFNAISQLKSSRSVVHIADYSAGEAYLNRDPMALAGVELAGVKTLLNVPMLKGGELIGFIGIFRQEVRPFTAKQIGLVQNFAAQAVIAIENTRLLNELRQRTDDLTESLKQQTATSEVLQVISSSPGELEPVFRAMLENATRVCEAKFGTLFRIENGVPIPRVSHGVPEPFLDFLARGPLAPSPNAPIMRAIRTKQLVHIADFSSDPTYIERNPMAVAGVELAGIRSLLLVPMINERELVGILAVFRQEVRPFTDKQIALIQNFAAQAVIAIENTRLLNELRQRTDDLTESLEQQTATSEVLGVISSSPGDLAPVFDAMLEKAVDVCDAQRGILFRLEGGAVRAEAALNMPEQMVEFMSKGRRPGPDSPMGQLFATKRAVHVPDVLASAAYLAGDPMIRAGVELAGMRTLLAVPLLKDNELIGLIGLLRLATKPFTDKQIEMVQNFAAQAVIAIENTRLLNELRQRTDDLTESLEQQTATADVLKVISRSTFDLQAVLQTLVESSRHLCRADRSSIRLSRNGVYHFLASAGYPPEHVEHMKANPIVPNSGSVVGRVVLERKAVHFNNVQNEPGLTYSRAPGVERVGSGLGIPLMREGEPIGSLLLMRLDVEPFSEKQIALATTFADQAVIAIENARLLNELRHRTDELSKSLEDLQTAQDRLVQTQKLASLGQLTAGIAHEIKNPLNFVNNFSSLSAELLDELHEALQGVSLDGKVRAEIDELTDTLRGNLEKIEQHGKRADSIVKNMLLHSREGSGEHRPVDINAVVEESLNLAYHGARAEKQGFNITLERAFDPAAGEVDVFPQEITRVLLNLIANGFYAATKRKSGEGDGYEPKLSAATKNFGDRVEIRIRDNGTGIPSEVKDKIFNPFFTTKPAGEGTGLGLSLSHDIIVKQHAGSIEVDTEPGQFTEFRIILPRTAASLAKSGGQA